MRTLFLFIALSTLISCKKKEECPGPKPGQTIINDVPGQYSGFFTSFLECNHTSSQDTIIECYMTFFNTPVNHSGYAQSTVNSIDVNGQYTDDYSFSYYCSVYYDSLTPISFKNFFNNLNYNFSSSKFGTISLCDNQFTGNFSNSNSIPLTFSNSNPYIITLNNVTNCTKIIISINNGAGDIERTILPSNPTAKFYASELNNTAVGNNVGLSVFLISSKDTTINGFKFKTEKNIEHRYMLTYTN